VLAAMRLCADTPCGGLAGCLHGGAQRIERRCAVRTASRVRRRAGCGVVVPVVIPAEARECLLAGAPCPGYGNPRLPDWNAVLCPLFNRPSF
jgi:hypothetical protein